MIRTARRGGGRSPRWRWAVLLAAVAGRVLGGEVGLPERPNILFIAADDLRMNLGCYGDTVAQTPNLDRLARRSRIFGRAYCQQAICNPSRASLMTGLRPDTLRVWNLTTHFRETTPDVVTLPQHFMRHGYFARNIGKIYHNYRTKIEGDPASWSVPAQLHFGAHGKDRPQFEGTLPPNGATVGNAEMRDVPDEAYVDGRASALAVAALRECSKKSEPFFLAVGFWKPHAPFNPPRRYWDLYQRLAIPPPSSLDPPKDTPAIALHPVNAATSIAALGPDFSPAERARITAEYRHGYYASTTYMDTQVGKVLDELERLDLADRTIVVFWSDHGYHLGEIGLWGKTTNFELDARVPLLISVPGMASRGVTSPALVELLDIYPTLVDLCGLPPVPGLEGVSLRPVLENPRATVKVAAFSQHPRPQHIGDTGKAMGYSLREDRYRYTEWREWTTGRVMATELYDHADDPDELRNLAVRPEGRAVIDLLAPRLEAQFPRRDLRK